MARNSRDVELIIRAKNAASKNIDEVAESLKDLTDLQAKAGASAGKAGTLFDRLSADLQKLQAEAKGLTALGAIGGQIDKAAAAVSRLEAESAQAASNLAALSSQQQTAAANTSRLSAEVKRLEAAYKAAEAATKATKTAQSQANSEVRKTESSIASLQTKLRGVAQPAADLVNRLQAQNAALTQLKEKQERATAAYVAQKAATEALNNQLKEAKKDATDAATAQGVLDRALVKSGNTAERQAAALETARKEFADMDAAAKVAAESLGRVGVAQNIVAGASEKTASAIAQVTAALGRQNAQRASTPALSGSALIAQQQAAQAENLSRARATFEAARAEANKLAAATRQAVGPNEELARSFNVAAAAARQAKIDYQNQQQALSGRGSFASFDNRIVAAEKEAAARRAAAAAEQEAARVSQAAASQAQAASTARAVATARAALQDRQGAAAAGQLSQAVRGTAGAAQQAGGAMATAAGQTNGLRGAFASLYGESRQALSLFQRIRGELLGLVAGYVGLYAAVQNIGGVINAYRTIEAAQNRLGAAFQQDSAKTKQEMRFLQAEANRLGIEFGVLSNEYAKFTIAASAANFQQDNTRKIFLAVAEAARVQKLSLDDTQGVFLALQQIISKGKVSSEELRRQLGDRLPGAFNIFAEAIGVSTAELDKMLQKGEVFATEDTLLKFADQLTSRFKGQLPDALQTLTTEIGRFQNSLFNAAAQVARGGFADALLNALRDLNAYFNSREGVEFFTSLGAALGKVVEVGASLIPYIREIFTVLKALVAIKVGQALLLMANSFQATTTKVLGARGAMLTFGEITTATTAKVTAFKGAMTLAGASVFGFGGKLRAAGVSATALGASMGVLRGGVVAVTGAFRLAFAALGGWVGIAISIASIALTNYFTDWAGAVDQSTAALEEHERIMAAVNETYASTKGNIDDLGKALKNVSLAEANKNFIDLTNAAAVAFKAIKDIDASAKTGRASIGANPEVEALNALFRKMQDGTITANKFREELAKLSTSFQSREAATLAGEYDKLAKTFIETFNAAAEQGKVAGQLGSTLEGVALATEIATKQQEALNKAQADTSGADAAAAANQEYATALANLRDQFPELKKQAELAQKVIEGITAAYNAFKAALDPNALGSIAKILASLGAGGPLSFMQALAEVGKGDFSKLGTVFQTLGQGLGTLLNPNGGDGSLASLITGAKGSLEASANVIKKFEGFRSDPYFDVNAFRAGFGSDTVTLADGSVHKITQGMKVSVEDANRDLIRRIGEFQEGIVSKIGADRFNAFNDSQKAALTSIAYNYGSLPDRIVNAIKTGSNEQIAEAIRALGSDNGGVNASRRSQEAGLFLSDSQAITDQNIAKTKEEADEAERLAKARKDALDSVNKSIEAGTFEVSQLQETARQAAINKALREEELKLQAQGLTLTQQQREQITANAGAIFDAANKEKEAAEARRQVEERVNQLYELRKQLQENITFAQEQGNTTQAEALKTQLTDVDAKLKEAIADAQAFYAKLGGPEADLANQKLQGISNSLVQVKQSFLDAKAVNDLFVNGLATAFTDIAKSIADVIIQGGSLKDILKGVGQAFLKFAADFLLQLGQMIVKQALFNALAGGGSGTGGIGGFLSSIFHRGGKVGPGAPQSGRKLPAWTWRMAPRFHSGGVPGLAANEYQAILKKNEEVLTEDDPRNALNGGLAAMAAGGGGGGGTKIINAFDASSFLSEALNSRAGEKAIFNFVKANPAVFKQAING